jgi:3-phenylpropionate/trans-cinnamate dioxygenase ferredoxin reductase subunit
MSAPRGMVVVGAGECGTRAAFALREVGYEGPVTLVGEEALAPYERPPLSKGTSSGMPHSPAFIVPEGSFAAKEICHIAGMKVISIDVAGRSVVLAGGGRLAYDRLLIATGARPRRLAMADGVSSTHYLRTYDDAVAIGRHLVAGHRLAIIGAGFIGLELAAMARRCGAVVTVLETAPRILMRAVPEEIAGIVSDIHLREGVAIRCGAHLSSIEENGGETLVTMANGEVLAFDALVVGIGAVPATELAQAAGLALENGIAVDETLRTSAPDIFAAGDCCSFPIPVYGGRRVRLEAWRNAQQQGNLAARNMLGAGERIDTVPWFWSDHYEWTLQIAGLSEGGVQTVVRPVAEGGCLVFQLNANGALISVGGIARGNTLARDIRLSEMLIAGGTVLSPGSLANHEVRLKSLLAT